MLPPIRPSPIIPICTAPHSCLRPQPSPWPTVTMA